MHTLLASRPTVEVADWRAPKVRRSRRLVTSAEGARVEESTIPAPGAQIDEGLASAA